jgi:hypothetical protein
MALSEREAAGMTVHERLFAAGLVSAFDEAVGRRDATALREILAAIHVDESSVPPTIEQVQGPDWAVTVEVTRRFLPGDWPRAAEILAETSLPLLGGPDRALDRARVKLALVKLASGDVTTLRRWAKEAATDWRDVLVAAGLAHADWRQVLAREGFAVPGGAR